MLNFHDLHKLGTPLVLSNIWDVGSARVVAKAGASALVTGSWVDRCGNRYVVGEKMPRKLLMNADQLQDRRPGWCLSDF
ncbi:MAG: isocitrate lyase/phosphoenolpyruvate mutase family protein [Phyllobacterium sp.]|uniref:isocitrate lyase/phosphoenolpyruvate mutase family protein n=1 Tax=Phyllobacterium sp. TaxID=1871046 RepID=UPI0030F36A50